MRTSGRAALLAEPNFHRADPGGRKHIKGGAKCALSLSNLHPTSTPPVHWRAPLLSSLNNPLHSLHQFVQSAVFFLNSLSFVELHHMWL